MKGQLFGYDVCESCSIVWSGIAQLLNRRLFLACLLTDRKRIGCSQSSYVLWAYWGQADSQHTPLMRSLCSNQLGRGCTMCRFGQMDPIPQYVPPHRHEALQLFVCFLLPVLGVQADLVHLESLRTRWTRNRRITPYSNVNVYSYHVGHISMKNLPRREWTTVKIRLQLQPKLQKLQ